MRIKFPESRRNWHDIHRDPMEERLFCFNDGPSGGDEPDGVTFTSGDDYTPGQGVQISSSTLAPSSVGDTYGGRNTSAAALEPFGGAGASVDDITSGRTNARGESLFTSGVTGDAEFTGVPSVAAPGALANLSFDPNQGFGEFDEIDFGGTGPRPQANVTVRPDVPSNLMTVFPGVLGNSIFQGSQGRNEPINRNVALTALQDRAVAGDISAQKELDDLGQQGAITFAEASYPQIQQQKALDATGITRAQDATAQNVLGSGISALDFDPNVEFGEFDSTVTGPISRPQMQGPPRMPDQVFDIDTRPASTPEYYGEDTLEADIFGRAGGPTGRGGDLQGFDKTGYEGRSDQPRDPNVSSMGAFADSATRGGVLGKVTDFGVIPDIVSRFTGQTPTDMRRENVMEFFDAGAQFNPESGKMEIPAGKGMLKMSDSGVVTYSGEPDPSYTGMYSNLVNPSMGGGGGSATATAQKSPTDPCPAGYKMVDGVCQPTGEEEGGGFQTGSGVGDTRFSPFYTPQQVGDISPFVLQPYRNES